MGEFVKFLFGFFVAFNLVLAGLAVHSLKDSASPGVVLLQLAIGLIFFGVICYLYFDHLRRSGNGGD